MRVMSSLAAAFLVADSTEPPTIWQLYWRVSRIARVQFRPEAASGAK